MQDPGARIVSGEANGDIVASYAHRDDVALNRVHVVISIAACTTDNVEDMTVEV